VVPDSPLSASPYEILGVPATASDDELRRAFRKALRDTHPDTGGDPQRFNAVQLAWDRVSSPQKRAAYDAGRGASQDRAAFTAQAARPRQDTRPSTRSYGHPGGWRRERYLDQLREWVGRGVTVDDPYDPVLVRSAPREIRRTLADALAEEATARTLNTLGIGFTAWHDVATEDSERKIDHIVLGPTGLFAMLSEDFGGPVRVRRGELIGDALAGEQPVHELAARARSLSRSLRVHFTALVIVLPDAAIEEPVTELGKVRGTPALAVQQSYLGMLLRQGLDGAQPIGGNELFDVRTRLGSVRYA
jgi:hypothetical protein